MPDLPNRDQHEAALTAAVLAVFDDYRRRVGTNGNFPSQEFHQRVQLATFPLLTATFTDSAKGLAADQSWDLSQSPLRVDSQKWASDRAATLATLTLDTTRDALATPGTDLQTIFGLPRAESIGITETTTAATAGEDWAAAFAMVFLFADDTRIEEYWDGILDSRQCPICSRLHATPKRVWSREFPDGPPAHPRCRCTRRFVVKTVEA